MSKQFIPTRKTDPCALCGDITGKCRTTQSVRLCMTLTEAIPVPGFRFLGHTKDDLWGKWVEDTGQDWTEQQRQAWQHELDRRRSTESQHPTVCLPASDRDPYYQQLLQQLPLHPVDRADLHRRGLSDEQIEQWGVKSVEQWQSLPWELPHSLPGVSLSGRSLNTSGSGYLCPIHNVEGQLVGFQIRLRDPGTNGRYRWLTSVTKKRPDGPSPHLPSGELPLAIHRPTSIQRPAIALVEGVGAKPFILAQRQGIVTVGAAGAQFASSPQTLKHTLAVLSEPSGTKTIEFYPDAGAILNRQVLRQYRKLWKLLRRWGYTIRVVWWGQETKDAPDIDELTDFSQITFLTTVQFEAIAPSLTWLKQITQRLQRRYTPKNSARALRHQLEETERPEYQPGDRLRSWQNHLQQGPYVLDNSAPGTGKSYTTGQLKPEMFGPEVNQIIYVSTQHRNPSVGTLGEGNGWDDLEARHDGLTREATPGGGSRLKRTSKGETPTIFANCNRTRLLGTLRDKYIQGADTASVICGTCPLREACSHVEGPGYGYLYQRRSALSVPKLRAHPDSLPDPREYDYSKTVLIWEESGQSLQVKRTISVNRVDLEQTIMALLPHPELLESIQGLLTVLLPYLQGEANLKRFGLMHTEVVCRFPDIREINLTELTEILRPNLSFLNTTAEYGADLADLPAALRKQFSEKDSEMEKQATQQVLKQWLPELLQILSGQRRGSLHIEHGVLTIYLSDPRHAEIARAAKANLFLDATQSQQDLALKLGVAPEQIQVVQQAISKMDNLTIIQVTDLGRLGMQRGKEQQRRAEAIVAHYQASDPTTKVIDFKRYAPTGEGAWWVDSRGVNDFEQTQTLVLVGTPCRNLADLQAEYAIPTGCHDPDDPGFQAFVNRAILADIYQAIGRLRAHRRLEEKLQVVLLSDFPLDIPTQTVLAREITMEAATRAEQTWQMITQAVKELWQQWHRQPTQQEIASATGVKQSQISKLAERFMGGWRMALKIFQSLLEIPYSDWNIFQPPEEATDEEIWVAREFLPLVVIEKVEGVLEQLGTVVKAFEWKAWQRIVGMLDPEVRSRLITAIALGLPVELQRGLIAASGIGVLSG